MKKELVFVVICFLMVSCDKKPVTDPTVSCSGPAKSFSADVNPIVQNSCATAISCHGAGSNTGSGPLLTYSQIFNARSTIRSEISDGHMPPNGGLTADQKSAILCWIDNGAPNN